MDDLSLAAEFPAATREQWLQRVGAVLKGADFSRKLIGHTYDGLSTQPLYPKAEDGQQLLRAETGPWRVSQRIDHPDPAEADRLALADLEGGADALTVVTRESPAARGFGLRIETLDDLDRALAGVMLDLVHIRVDAGGHARQVAALFTALAERRGQGLSGLSVDFGLDPIGSMAAMGKLSASWSEVSARCADTLTGLAGKGFSGRAFLADGRPYHEAGASEAQELSAVLATGIAYLRALEAGGHALGAARDALSFLLTADADEFLTVAKFRAMRRLWARVEQACGLEPKPIRLHAETAWRVMTRRDPWVNILRTTVAVFSAGIGGADAITALPFTTALGLPDAFARRVARNTQLVLLEEANLWRVADPAAGAGGFEALTEELCEKAWSLLQELEQEGGIVKSLKSGAIQQRIAAIRGQRERAIATRKDPLTGTSEFPNIAETVVTVLFPSPLWGHGAAAPTSASPPRRRGESPQPADASFTALMRAASGGASLADLAGTAPGAQPIAIDPLPSRRAAEPFEVMRDRSDERLERSGSRPKVFLANLGPIAAFTARATFAKNLFEAGGIEARTNDGFSSLDALLEAYRASGARLACLCSSDEIYQSQAVAAAAALRQAGASDIYLAGRPGQLESRLIEAGVTGFIHVGCDVLTTLDRALGAAS